VFGGFEPIDQAAVVFAPTTCDIPFVGPTAVSAVMVAFTDYVGACDVLAQTQFCGTRESSAAVLALAVSGVPGGTTVGPVGAGTYPYLRDPPTASFLASAADAGKVGVDCAAIPGGNLDGVGGRVVLASVTDSAVTGAVDLRFDDGTSFQHPIDAALCPLPSDLCSRFLPCFDYACVQAP
jgi:hypothetical protein